MKKQMIMASLATAAFLTLQPLTYADIPGAPASTNTPPANRAIGGGASAQTGDQATSGQGQGAASTLLSRGDMSEKDFDKHFVMHAAQSNMTEIQIAKVAEQKAQDPAVKQYAQMLIKDHEQAGEKLKQIAESKGITVPAQLNEVGTAKVAESERMSGPGFDRHFVFCMAGDHLTAVLWYRASAQLLQDPQLKEFAEQTLPTLKHHLREVERLAGADEAITAGAHIRGSHGDNDTSGGQTGASTPSDSGSSNTNKTTTGGTNATGAGTTGTGAGGSGATGTGGSGAGGSGATGTGGSGAGGAGGSGATGAGGTGTGGAR